jgi:error-prone DNA polymerase
MDFPGSTGLIALPTFSSAWNWDHLKEMFQDRLYLPLSRFLDGEDHFRTERALLLSQKHSIPLVATNEVHYHHPSRRDLQDVLTGIREGVTLEEAGYRLFSNRERYLKSPQQMMQLFSDLPEAIENTVQIAQRCHFSLSELKYRYPSEWIPNGHSAQTYLTELVWRGTKSRYPEKVPAEVKAQLLHELKLIDELQFADYFLTIWEIVEFAKKRKILCQGRGSAANSVVCYVLGITAIDPVRMNLLFERFISTERGEPPDIDVDFENERREEVIQHIYEKYGRDRAAMVSAVITYRSRSALREVSKVFKTPQPSLQEKLVNELKGFPRHLSIHSGGFTLSADPMIEIVPIEPARMDGRTIIQWDKYDLDTLGLLKVDILALGMLTALKKTMNLIGDHFTLQSIPSDDPKTYQMIQQADTVGTFQIESRAQMSMLPRLLPKTFYDLVIEVALVRPGPIVGKMVHPYLKRRKGLEPVTIPHPLLEPILRKTLGVPIFQEQVMKMAIQLADFTPGEADQLRRAIGAWRSAGSIDEMGKRLMNGLLKNGIPQDFADRVFQQVQGFSEYGFPESHAASFALIAYASAYLKCHHPAEFTCALLNSQPMGFYAPHTLVDDAKRHGVRVYPIHPNLSKWDCHLENGGIRLGFRYVLGVQETEILNLLAERAQKPFRSLVDFLERSHLRQNMIHRLALGDAFTCFGLDQRAALWSILAHQALQGDTFPEQLSLFSHLEETSENCVKNLPFKKMDEYESIRSDYSAYTLSTRGHPMKMIRKKFPRLPKLTTLQAKQFPHGRTISLPGLSVVMQRPPTAAGTAFATIEDETGFLDLIFHKKIFEKFRDLILDHCFLIVTGKIQRDGNSISLIVQNIQSFLYSKELEVNRHLSEGVRSRC